jgi:hypothetical protein
MTESSLTEAQTKLLDLLGGFAASVEYSLEFRAGCKDSGDWYIMVKDKTGQYKKVITPTTKDDILALWKAGYTTTPREEGTGFSFALLRWPDDGRCQP